SRRPPAGIRYLASGRLRFYDLASGQQAPGACIIETDSLVLSRRDTAGSAQADIRDQRRSHVQDAAQDQPVGGYRPGDHPRWVRTRSSPRRALSSLARTSTRSAQPSEGDDDDRRQRPERDMNRDVTTAAPQRGRPRSEKAHNAILEAAAELLLEKGLAAVSMDAVAA